MAVKKEYSKNKKSCKVTFSIPKEIGDRFKMISLVGDFNNWDPKANIFSETEKDGTYSLSIVFDSGNEYQFRYLGDGVHWFNEHEADKEIETYFPGATNSIVIV
ncbi:hypothetical protein MNBD_IGNAVI01-1521 [hydrothermal vent metagenome]|uniref:1,4-alpha-glucan branching enzyme n=1 Tax=hydrothermal vent metagenome TaxID=652676 RepID=A0A3B1CC33_9ZZZZ